MPDVDVSVEWLPFFLDPSLPPAPVSKRDWYNKRYGEERVSQMIGGMQKTATAEGIDIVYTGDISTTLPAHRLISWSKAKGKQNELVEKIFVQYFAKGKAPADVDMLVQAAVDAGLDRAEAQAFLDGSELKAEVVDEAEHVKRSFGVSGVPFFVVHVDGADALPIGVSGAQEPDVLVKIVREALENSTSTAE
eukprot:m.379151 g.379151  ORF g.379151 m.379151 type:complete len:192 (-) comp28229_c0_seq4:1626-2201(-)